ncbi:MAG: prepilin-type N-terminal cleavage/methylation domain-containing protein [Firmicutes bacterium]|nr:prepilin-type N-terminal cleavage/methylation domain-containing protein [Bacillota bacterium]
MKLNNKGLSLMELLVSIVLVGIVLVFLSQLLVDLRTEIENNDFAFKNQVNKTEAIYTIQKDLGKYTLLGVEDISSGGNIAINFYFKKGINTKTASLVTTSSTKESLLGDTITIYHLNYTNVDGEKYSWEMKNAEVDNCGLFTYYYDVTSNNYYFKLNIYLYNSIYHERNNKDKNNAVDDIEIVYTGLKDDLDVNVNYLTNNVTGDKKIGSCTNNPM